MTRTHRGSYVFMVVALLLTGYLSVTVLQERWRCESAGGTPVTQGLATVCVAEVIRP